MKKIVAGLIIILLIAAPYFLPMPLVTSGFVAQYALGESVKFDIAAWNISPLSREIKADNATDVVLKIDGTPIANTTTDVAPRISQFSRVEHTVEYRISKTPASSPGFDTATGEIELPPGEHTIAVEWLGASSWGSKVRIIQL